MKKHIYTGILLFLMGIGSIQAQDTRLFRFISQTDDDQRLVLHHNLTDNSVEIKPISSITLNRTDGYLQSFILQPVEGRKGVVLIASAKAPDYFLKRNGTNVAFEKIEAQSLEVFSWSISFNGKVVFDGKVENEVAIVSPEVRGNSAIGVLFSNNSIINRGPDINIRSNGRLRIDDDFVFIMQQVTNVF